MTPCHWAALNGHLEITKLLINYGARRQRKTNVCYYNDTSTIKLYVWNVHIKKCMYKLLFAQHEIYWVESILWYMYLYIIDSLFQAFKCDQHTHYTQNLVWHVFQITYMFTCLHRILVSRAVHMYRISVVSTKSWPENCMKSRPHYFTYAYVHARITCMQLLYNELRPSQLLLSGY